MLTVKQFVELLNCFPELRKLSTESGDACDNRGILINFSDVDDAVDTKSFSKLPTRFPSEFCLETEDFCDLSSYDDKKDSLTSLAIQKTNLESDGCVWSCQDDEWSDDEMESFHDLPQPETDTKPSPALQILKSPKFIFPALFVISLCLAFSWSPQIVK